MLPFKYNLQHCLSARQSPLPLVVRHYSLINNNWTRCIPRIHEIASSLAAAVHRRISRHETWGTRRETEGHEGVESGEKIPLIREGKPFSEIYSIPPPHKIVDNM